MPKPTKDHTSPFGNNLSAINMPVFYYSTDTKLFTDTDRKICGCANLPSVLYKKGQINGPSPEQSTVSASMYIKRKPAPGFKRSTAALPAQLP